MRALRTVAPLGVLALAAHGAGAVAADTDATWVRQTSSPQSIDASELSDRDAELLARCGRGEAGLFAVARAAVARKARGLPPLDTDGLAFAQRSAGEPHVWPRAWLISGRALDHGAVLERLGTWQRGFHDLGERRCGIARGTGADGTEIVAVVAVDALADLTPLPTRARTGAWLTFEGRMLVQASRARLVVMGPSGSPRTVPTSIDGARVRATFALDRPGAFTVQLVADGPTGPRPVLEASVFADVAPPLALAPAAAPGEAEREADAPSTLARMVAVVREREGLSTLRRDARLDAIARDHARRMLEARTVGHDVGDGDPSQRLAAAGLETRDAGENVAHAPSVPLAHRALYASPSHRANMLRSEFDALGVAAVSDADGSVWVAEVFARATR